MSHNCFISFKKEDLEYCKKIAAILDVKSISVDYLNEWINSEDLNYVIQKIRSCYMDGTSVTLYLIGKHSSENEGLDEYGRSRQSFMIRELQATLLDKKSNRLSGLVGIVLPEMESLIYGGSYHCEHCGKEIDIVNINDNTVLREFSANYWLKMDSCGHYSIEGRYPILVKYADFMSNPDKYINEAFAKTQSPIADQVHYKDIEHEGMRSFEVSQCIR